MTTNLAILASGLLLLVAFAPCSANAATMDMITGNWTPEITSVSLGSSSLTPVAGTTVSTLVTVVVSDLNGYQDISSVTVGILKPDGSTVHAAQAAATFSSGSATSATYTKTISMNYYDAAALTTSTYKVKAVVTDVILATATNSASTFNYAELSAANVPSSLNVGTINPGATGSIVTMAIGNYGNTQIDVQLSSTTPTKGSDTVPVSGLKYSLNSDMTSSTATTTSAVTQSTFNLAAGSGSSKTIYWQMTMPSGSTQYVPAGTYSSTLTVTAVAG